MEKYNEMFKKYENLLTLKTDSDSKFKKIIRENTVEMNKIQESLKTKV